MTETLLDYVIVGAGPAGLQMAYQLQEANRAFVVLERGDCPGYFFSRFPRQRNLLSINKRYNFYTEDEYNLRHDWNSLLSRDANLRMAHHSKDLYPTADSFVDYLKSFAEHWGLPIRFRAAVQRIVQEKDGAFTVADEGGNVWRTRAVLMATGAIQSNIPADVEGIELTENYESYDTSPELYENQRVAIIGAGNSAFEVAGALANHAAIVHVIVGDTAPKLAWDTHTVSDVRAVNIDIFDMWQLKSLHSVIAVKTRKITKNTDGSLTLHFEERVAHWQTPGVLENRLTYDRIICCTGWRYLNDDIFEASIAPRKTECGRYPELSPRWESSTPGIYYLGTAMASRDKRSASGFIHGFRYNVRTLFHLLEERFFGVAYPKKSFALTNETELKNLTQWVFERLSTSSALYQLNGFLADALVYEEGEARLYQELPIDLIRQRADLIEAPNLCILSLEYGFHRYDPYVSSLEFVHTADPAVPESSAFLHPVLRRYEHGKFIEEIHFHESLDARYSHESFLGNRVLNLFNRMSRVTARQFNEGFYLKKFRTLDASEITEDESRLRYVPLGGPR